LGAHTLVRYVSKIFLVEMSVVVFLIVPSLDECTSVPVV
jgi:hypothetical protein